MRRPERRPRDELAGAQQVGWSALDSRRWLRPKGWSGLAGSGFWLLDSCSGRWCYAAVAASSQWLASIVVRRCAGRAWRPLFWLGAHRRRLRTRGGSGEERWFRRRRRLEEVIPPVWFGLAYHGRGWKLEEAAAPWRSWLVVGWMCVSRGGVCGVDLGRGGTGQGARDCGGC